MAKPKPTPTSSAPSKKKGPTDAKKAAAQKVVTRNRRASHDYELVEEVDCGIVLTGSEVKSIRNGKIVIDEAYGRIQNDEFWLLNVDIAEYPQASFMNHERRRERKLMVRKPQLRKLIDHGNKKGLTFIPLSVFFERGFVKVRMAVARGLKTHDKRDKLKEKADAREMRAAKQVRIR